MFSHSIGMVFEDDVTAMLVCASETHPIDGNAVIGIVDNTILAVGTEDLTAMQLVNKAKEQIEQQLGYQVVIVQADETCFIYAADHCENCND